MDRLVVVGGGIAGLAAAMSLRRYFSEVCVIERDGYYRDDKSVRSHTPQGHHVHVLLARGLLALTRIVPQLPDWLDEMGLREGDLAEDVRICFNGKWLPRHRSGIPVRPCTRAALEHLLLRAAENSENIRVLEKCRVVGILGRDEVEGVRVLGESGDEEIVKGDLVVLASGRASQLPNWLKGIAIDEIPEDIVDAGVTYNSCIFRAPSGYSDDWRVIASSPKFPDQPEGGVIMRVGDGEWLAALVGYSHCKSPKTPEELRERLAALFLPPFCEVLRGAVPCTAIARFGKIVNRRRRFGKMKRWPDRLVVIGDSVCSLNPRYGQGMTVAALGAEALGDVLERHLASHRSLEGFSARFQRKLDRILTIPWQTAMMEDRLWMMRMKGLQPRLPMAMLMRFTQGMLDAAFSDAETYTRFMRVAHMLDNPARLLSSPHAVAQIISHGMTAGR